MLLEKLRLEAQLALDDLWVRKSIAFQLVAHKIDSIGSGEYIIRFRDGPLHSVDVSWNDGDAFQDVVRVAVTARFARFEGPLQVTAQKSRRRQAGA